MIGISMPSCETMWTSTDDCFCHEHVRQSWSPNPSYAHWRSSSARIDSKSSSGSGGAVAKEHLLQRVGAETAAERFERDHFVRRDVPEVHVSPEVLDEPGLRGLGRRLEDEIRRRDVVDDLVDQAGPHL